MATQADYRMILGIKQQPNQWAEALSNLPGNLMQGMQIGDYFRERSRESQLQELMRGAIDPQTGEVDTGKALGALMQFDPAMGIKLMQQDRLERLQSQGLQAAMQGDYSPEERQILQGYASTGEIGKGIAKIGELRYGKSTTAENRAQELIPGVVNTINGPVEVTDTRENWARYRQQLQSGSIPQSQPQSQSGAAPQGQPQAQIGQIPAIGSNLTPVEQQSMQAPPQAGDTMDKAAWDRLRTNDPEGARAFLRKMPLQQRNLFLQAMYAENGPQTVIPAMPSQPNPVNPAGTGLPPGAIQRGLSPGQQQEIKIQEEDRANRAKSNLMLQQDYLTSQRQIERDTLEQKSAEAISYSRKTAEERVAMSKGWREKHEAATKAMPLINEMENYIKEGALDEGSLAGIYGKIGGLMYSLGAREDGKLVMQNRMNRGFDSTANQLTFAKLGEKLGAQISDADREFILTFSPKVGDQPEAAKRMIRILKGAFNRDINQYTGWLKSGKPNEFDYQIQWNNNLMDEFSKQSRPIPTPEEAAAELARRRGAR